MQLVDCLTPDECKAKGVEGVCRARVCRTDVPCEDDVECGRGESCEGGVCRFSGCMANSDCDTGRCNFATFTCAECATNAECSGTKPVCNAAGVCVGCGSDSDCQPPGPGYCETTSGTCVHCNTDSHCPPGLNCQAGVCTGALENSVCGGGVDCAQGLICVTVGNNDVCRTSCNLYSPNCPAGQVCLKLTFSGSPSLVFETGAPLGVCSPPFSGLKFYRESCGPTQPCQPNLQCVQDSPTTSTCKAYCDPAAPQCQTGELCHPYPGDFYGHEYGLCYGNTGVGDACSRESACDGGQSCTPRPDPTVFNNVSTECRFYPPATAPGLSPCTADNQCRSSFCANDPAVSTAKFYCFAACAVDADCSVSGRTGYCDTTSNITIAPYPATTIRGCRPACDNAAACTAYNANFTCRMVTQTAATGAARTRRTCQPPLGAGKPGDFCSGNADCASGFCWRRDSRGQFRSGICTAPCVDNNDCTAALLDGGTASLGCSLTTLNHTAGPDGIINSADDVDAVSKVCAPPACAADEECPALYPQCTVDADPAASTSGLVLRCRSAALGAKRGGDACTNDSECSSGACAEVVAAPGTRVCLQPCVTATTTCAAGLTCRTDGARVLAKNGSAALFTACVP